MDIYKTITSLLELINLPETAVSVKEGLLRELKSPFPDPTFKDQVELYVSPVVYGKLKKNKLFNEVTVTDEEHLQCIYFETVDIYPDYEKVKLYPLAE